MRVWVTCVPLVRSSDCCGGPSCAPSRDMTPPEGLVALGPVSSQLSLGIPCQRCPILGVPSPRSPLPVFLRLTPSWRRKLLPGPTLSALRP